MIWGKKYDQMLLWISANGYYVSSRSSSKNTNGTTTGGAYNADSYTAFCMTH